MKIVIIAASGLAPILLVGCTPKFAQCGNTGKACSNGQVCTELIPGDVDSSACVTECAVHIGDALVNTLALFSADLGECTEDEVCMRVNEDDHNGVCLKKTDKPEQGEQCSEHSDCKSGYMCENGWCVVAELGSAKCLDSVECRLLFGINEVMCSEDGFCVDEVRDDVSNGDDVDVDNADAQTADVHDDIEVKDGFEVKNLDVGENTNSTTTGRALWHAPLDATDDTNEGEITEKIWPWVLGLIVPDTHGVVGIANDIYGLLFPDAGLQFKSKENLSQSNQDWLQEIAEWAQGVAKAQLSNEQGGDADSKAADVTTVVKTMSEKMLNRLRDSNVPEETIKRYQSKMNEFEKAVTQTKSDSQDKLLLGGIEFLIIGGLIGSIVYEIVD